MIGTLFPRFQPLVAAILLGCLLVGCPIVVNPPDPVDKDDVSLTREHASTFTPGTTLEVAVEIGVAKGVDISAIALVEQAPPGWVYVSAVGADGTLPSIRPLEGSGGDLTFVWIQTPKFPYIFTYTLEAPQTAPSTVTLAGHVEYREGNGGAAQTDTLTSTVARTDS